MIVFNYNPAFNSLWIILGALGIALIVFLIRKFVPGIKGEDIKEDEEDIAKRNVSNRVVEFKQEEKDEEDESEEDE